MHLEELKAQVEANTAVINSAVTLITGLAAKIDELKDNPVELAKLAEDLKANSSALSEAIAANTPAAEPTE